MNISQCVAAANKFSNFVIPKTKAGNEQCTSTAPFMSAQLKLTGIPQSANDEIYNEAKGMAQFEKDLEIILRTKHNRPK